jgi:hypothetical protein
MNDGEEMRDDEEEEEAEWERRCKSVVGGSAAIVRSHVGIC